MSNTFKFKNNTLSLTICDLSYTLTLDENTVGICDKIRSDAKEYLSRLNDENNDADAAISDICIFFEQCIDRLLGVGATKAVFGTRPLKLLDLTDLLSFILSKIGSSVAGRIHGWRECKTEA